MNFKNLFFYVRRKIDTFLRAYRLFARAYINNIVIFNHILKKHLIYLYVVFQLFNSYNINLSSKKSFLNYSIIILLRLKIDVFDFIIAIDKLKIISKLNFFYTLKNLKFT